MSWTATSSGSWNSAGDWSGGLVPQAGDDVVINQAGNIQVALTTSTAVKSILVTGDTLAISNATLSVAANSLIGVSGTLNLSSGTLALASGATLANSGSITLSSGSQLTVGGVYTESVNGGLNLSPGTTGTGVGTNLLGNAGFESPSAGSGTTTSPSVWGRWGASYVSKSYEHGGLQSIVESGSNSGVYQTFTASPGVSYSASIYALNPADDPLTGAQGAFMNLVFYDANNNPISTPSVWTNLVNASTPTGVWNHSVATLVAPGNAATIKIYLQVGPYVDNSTTSAGWAYMDDVQLGPTATGTANVISAGISNSGAITIGAGDTITDSGIFTQNTTGSLALQLGGPAGGNDYGRLSIAGAAAFGGTLTTLLVNGYSPSINDGFTLISYASESGGFSTIQLPTGSGYTFDSGVNPTYLGISAVPPVLTTTVNTSTAIASVTNNLVGVNLAYWDNLLNTAQTQQVVQAAGISVFRFPGGSASDDFHFNVAQNWGDSAANTIPQFANFITQVGGTGIVTVDYGSASPQEAIAELAYLEGSTTDNTTIGTGIEWNDSAQIWQNINWGTVAYWAGLRAATAPATDDGLNFLRINRSSPFLNIPYWEIGNEEYGSWEIDNHGSTGPAGVSTGTQYSAGTYALFAATFAAFVANDTKLPAIQIGIDAGSPTADYGAWTQAVVKDLYNNGTGYVPGFISDHSYMQGPGDENDSFLLNDTVSDAGSLLDWSTRYADYEAMLQGILGTKAASVKIMATEFNSNYGTEGKQMTSIVNGLFVADSMGSLLNSGYTAGLVWDLRNGWTTDGNNSSTLYGWRQGGDEGILGTSSPNSPPSTGPYVAYPTYFAEQLASKFIQAGAEDVPAVSTYAQMSAYSVIEPNGHLELMVVNKNPDATISDQFNLTGFLPSGQAQVWQYGEAQDYAQSQSPTGAAALADTNGVLNISGESFACSFPAYSMTVIDLVPLAAQSGSTLTIDLNALAPVTIVGSGGNVIVTENGDQSTFSGVSAITVVGSTAGSVLNFNGSVAAPIAFVNTSSTSLIVNSGTLMMAGGTGAVINPQLFSSVTIMAGASMVLLPATSQAGRTLLDTQSLSIAGSMGHWTGKLDLNGNDTEVQLGSLANIEDQIKSGAGLATGILSSTAANTGDHLTILGAILNTADGTVNGMALYNANNLFDGTSPPTTAVLVKYTYFGDTNLDGKVDGSDYSRLDNGYLQRLTGWFNGDFNYDQAIDGSDYTLIDNTFNSQGAIMSTQIVLPKAAFIPPVRHPSIAGIGSMYFVRSSLEPELWGAVSKLEWADDVMGDEAGILG